MNWRDNPELLDELTGRNLPEPWKTRVAEGQIELNDVPDDVRSKAMGEASVDYVSSRADYVYEIMKERRCCETN